MQFIGTNAVNGKLLSIIIPTYNGGEWIGQGIRSIAQQIGDMPEVEFIVRDNASTDKTKEVVVALQKEYPGTIKYYRRNENTPFLDINFKEAIDISSGEYIMLVGDDDALMPFAVSYLVKLIKGNRDISLFYANRIVANWDFTHAYLRDSRMVIPGSNTIYNNITDFLQNNINGPDFISVNVIKRTAYLSSANVNTTRYYGYEWYGRYLFGARNKNVMGISVPLTVQRLPRKRSWGKQSVLYALVGLSNLLYDIDDSRIVYDKWMEYLHNKGRIYVTLSGLTHNKPLYREKYTEIITHLNRLERFDAWLLLHFGVYKYLHSFVLIVLKKLKYIA